jgi:hypothetical protein
LIRLAAAAAAALCLAACAPHLLPPASMRWGLPVYPRASFEGASQAGASVAIYRTADKIEDVDAWYAAELPRGTMHAVSAGRSSTFALFGPRERRTVHLQSDGRTTTILLTEVAVKPPS